MSENRALCAECHHVEVDRDAGEVVCDPCYQHTLDEVVAELFASGEFRNAPCADCGTLTFFVTPRNSTASPVTCDASLVIGTARTVAASERQRTACNAMASGATARPVWPAASLDILPP